VKASTKIRRSEFGIISLSPLVSDEVTLCMRVEALRYASL
jgi:polyisoprenoid-binding protein YceI